MKMILVAMVTFDKQLFMKLDSLLLLLSPPTHTLHLPMFHEQVCICTNPRNHLEHLPWPHDDSEPPTRTQYLAKIDFRSTPARWGVGGGGSGI